MFLLSSQHEVSSDFYSPHLPYTILGFNNVNFSKRMSCLIVVKKKALHKSRRVEMMVKITGQKKKKKIITGERFVAILFALVS